MMKSIKKVNSYNEWDPLTEVIVGVATNAKHPEDDLGEKVGIAFEDGLLPNLDVKLPVITRRIIDETNEDLEIFVSELKKLNITVHRPEPIDTTKVIVTPYWETTQYFNYCPRDILLIVGDTIIESPNAYRSRYFETLSYRDLLNEYLRAGSKWIVAPKPRLREKDYLISPGNSTILTESDPMFDAANVLKAGSDLFYLISNSGNDLGLTWLQNTLGDGYRVHPCPGIYKGMHIDTTLVFLRPGLVLANPKRVNADNLPPLLKQWKVIYAPDMEEYDYSGLIPTSSKWLGMNLLMINPSLAVVDAHQKALIKLLEKHKIDVLPLKLRHGRVLDGGFRCSTLELRREGNKQDYFE